MHMKDLNGVDDYDDGYGPVLRGCKDRPLLNSCPRLECASMMIRRFIHSTLEVE